MFPNFFTHDPLNLSTNRPDVLQQIPNIGAPLSLDQHSSKANKIDKVKKDLF